MICVMFSWYGGCGESWFWAGFLQNQLGGLVRDASVRIKANFSAKLV